MNRLLSRVFTLGREVGLPAELQRPNPRVVVALYMELSSFCVVMSPLSDVCSPNSGPLTPPLPPPPLTSPLLSVAGAKSQTLARLGNCANQSASASGSSPIVWQNGFMSPLTPN